MGKQILTDCRIFTGGADLSAMSNQAEVQAEVEEKDGTTFTSLGWTELLAGLGSGEINASGFWEAGDASKVDDATWAGLGGLTAWTVCPTVANVGALAYFMKAMQGNYAAGGEVGEIAPYKADAKSTWPVVRGQIGHPAGTARTTTGTGSSVQLGAVPAGKSLYAAIHVLGATGTTPSLTARVESDNATGFPSAVTQMTFVAATALGGQILRVPGPITDDWFRFAWTISGTTPSFLFVGALGIA